MLFSWHMSQGVSSRQIWLVSAFIALAVGGTAGWVTSSTVVQPGLQRAQELLRQALQSKDQWNNNASSTQPTPVQIIPVQPTDGAQLALPESLRGGRATPTLSLFRVASGATSQLVYGQDQSASVVALTADGWVVLPTAALPATVKLSELAVGSQHRLFVPKKGLRDRATGLTYLKIDTQNLPVATLVSRTSLELGQSAWREEVPNQYTETALLRVGSLGASSVPLSSDTWSRRLILTERGTASSTAAIWDARGRLIGLADAAGATTVVPADAIRTGLTSLLATGDIRRATLGVHAIDLADTYVSADRAALPTKGAWLQGDRKKTLLAVSATSTAKEVLRENDVIERIDNDILDGTWGLAEHVLEYRPGAEVTLTGLRDGKTFTVPVKFGTAVTSEELK